MKSLLAILLGLAYAAVPALAQAPGPGDAVVGTDGGAAPPRVGVQGGHRNSETPTSRKGDPAAVPIIAGDVHGPRVKPDGQVVDPTP